MREFEPLTLRIGGGFYNHYLIFIIMDNEQKAQRYNQLMFEYTKTQNKISSIKGESFELNNNQLREIRELENKLRFLMESASRL